VAPVLYRGTGRRSLITRTNIFQGINKFAGLKYGVGNSKTSFPLKLSSPTAPVFNTSGRRQYLRRESLDAGAGPTLTYLPFFASGHSVSVPGLPGVFTPCPRPVGASGAYYEDFESQPTV